MVKSALLLTSRNGELSASSQSNTDERTQFKFGVTVSRFCYGLCFKGFTYQIVLSLQLKMKRGDIAKGLFMNFS